MKTTLRRFLCTPAALCGALTSLAFGLFSLVTERSTVRVPQPPDLFEPKHGCAVLPPAAKRARDLKTRALAKLERYAFAPHEGVEAIVMLSESVHCFLSDGERADASSVQTQLATWKIRIDRDYRDHQLRLHHALLVNRKLDVQNESRALLLLLGPTDCEYTQWLRQVAGAS